MPYTVDKATRPCHNSLAMSSAKAGQQEGFSDLEAISQQPKAGEQEVFSDLEAISQQPEAGEQEVFSDIEPVSEQPLATVHDINFKERAPDITAETEINALDDKEHPEHGNKSNNRQDQGNTGTKIRQYAGRHWVPCVVFATLLIILAAVLGGVLGSREHKDPQKPPSLDPQRTTSLDPQRTTSLNNPQKTTSLDPQETISLKVRRVLKLWLPTLKFNSIASAPYLFSTVPQTALAFIFKMIKEG